MSEKSASRVTTDHEEIRKWVESQGGKPFKIKGSNNEGSGGFLRLDFESDGPEENLEEISWEEFFSEFDKERLAFLYQDDDSGSRFVKLINRDNS